MAGCLRLVVLWLLVALALGPVPACGQDAEGEAELAADTSGVPKVTREAIESRLAALPNLGLSEADAAAAAEGYQQALQSLAAIDQQLEAQQQFAGERSKLRPREVIEADLDHPIEQVLRLLPLDPAAPLTALEQRATKLDWYETKWRTILSELEAAPAKRSARLAELPQLVAQAESEQKALTTQLAESPDEASNEVASARRAAQATRYWRLGAVVDTLREEEKLYRESSDTLALQRDLAARKREAYEKMLGRVREVINQRRMAEAASQAESARREVATGRQPAPLAKLAESNQQLTAQREELANRIARVTGDLTHSRQAKLQLQKEFDEMQDRLGDKLTQSEGQLLRERRGKLPSLPALRRTLAKMQDELGAMQSQQYDCRDQRSELYDLDSKVTQLLTEIDASGEVVGESEVRRVIESHRLYLDNLIQDYDSYTELLGNCIAEHAAWLETAEQYTNFIAERDLWIRSCAGLSRDDLRSGSAALAWSLAPQNWWSSVASLVQSAQRRPEQSILLGFALALVLMVQRRCRKELRQIGEEAAKKNCVSLGLSLRAVWLTLVVSLPWPVTMWAAGWYLYNPVIESEFVRSLSVGLTFTAYVLLATELLRHALRAGGLAHAHFDWYPSCLVQFRRLLRLVGVVVLPLGLWMVGLETQAIDPHWSSSLGRGLFITVMLVLSVAWGRLLLTPGSPTLQLLQRGGAGWLVNLHSVWRPVVVALPIALAVLAGVGYYYTAQQLTLRLLQSLAVVAVLLLLGGLLRRGILLNRRRLAREQARQRRAQAAAGVTSSGGDPSFLPNLGEAADDLLDLSALSEQTRKLMRTVLVVAGLVGMALIWHDVLPALGRLDANPLPLVNSPNSANPITWGSLLRLVLVLVVTYAAVRDLPSLLELIVLQHLPLDKGARYAVTSLCRYMLLAVGVIVAANSLGINGTSLQWLVAAMGVGLGFGLQEIFANFVSGLILLFERPIRVGDVVTLGETTGMVSRIRIRATTIIDWDRKEYIVPNKDLVTERLLNWTLTDQVNRVIVKLGVAYGTDTNLATSLLTQIANEHPRVLKDPAPLAMFESFGDSTLNLSLRCFLPELEHRLTTIHDLHTAIDAKFREVGIEIAFPQTDLNIRNVSPAVLQSFASRVPPASESESKGIGRHAPPLRRTVLEVDGDE